MSTSQNRKTDKYRLKFIGALIKSDCNSEETALLSQTAAEQGISLIDLCAMYNILQYAHQRSKNRYPARKIIEVIGLTAANAAKAKIPPVELAKRICGTLFDVRCSRANLDEIEQETRGAQPEGGHNAGTA